MHTYVDEEGNKRQAFYSCQQKEAIPDDVSVKIGQKRSHRQAVSVQMSTAIQVHHVRDYAFSHIEGGTKGEKADYILVATGDNEIRYVPVTNKFKLNKKRRAKKEDANLGYLHDDNDEPQVFVPKKQVFTNQVQNIVIAPRAYSKDDVRQINSNLSLVGNKAHALSKDFVVFDSK
jgi:preprotein translocase subunit SecD